MTEKRNGGEQAALMCSLIIAKEQKIFSLEILEVVRCV